MKIKMNRGVIVFAAIIMVTMTIPAVMGQDMEFPPSPDYSPIADAGGPYEGPAGSPIQFNGTGSFDPDGTDIILYEWNFGDGTEVSTEDPITTYTYGSAGVYTVTLTVYDSDDDCTDYGTATTTATITEISQPPANQPPEANAGPDQTVDEGASMSFSGSFTDPDATDTHTIEWDFGDSTTYSGTLTPTHVYVNDGVYIVTLTVTDDGGAGTDTLIVTVNNVAPTVEAGADQTVNEGDMVSFSGSFSDPGAEDTHTIKWDFGDGEMVTGTPTPYHAYADNGVYTVTLTVTDDDGGVGSDTCTITVNNVAPTVGPIVGAPIDPIQVGTVVTVSADFTDPGSEDTHTAEWDWGDGSTAGGTVIEADGSGSVEGLHTYSTAGVYTITLIVTDDDGASASVKYEFVVVYDPSAGFVTGGGWIISPEGAYTPDPALTGKATFGFVSKYKKGATVPTGQTEFQFHAGDLNFHSTSYDWLVIAGAKAQYKGTGTINGAGNYGFMLTAIDETLTPSTDVDLFRIKIWDNDNGDTIVYDNQIDAPDDADPVTTLGGGSIVVHKSK